MAMIGFDPIKHLIGPYATLSIDRETFKSGLNQLRAVEIILHFCISSAINPTRTYETFPSGLVPNDPFSSCWPVLDAHTAKEFRQTAFKWIDEKRKAGCLGKDVVARRSTLDDCHGDKFEQLLLSIAKYTVREWYSARYPKQLKEAEEDIQQECKNVTPQELIRRLQVADDKITQMRKTFTKTTAEKNTQLRSSREDLQLARNFDRASSLSHSDKELEKLDLPQLIRIREEKMQKLQNANVDWKVLRTSSDATLSSSDLWTQYQEQTINFADLHITEGDEFRIPSMSTFLDKELELQTARLHHLESLSKDLVQKLVLEVDKCSKLNKTLDGEKSLKDSACPSPPAIELDFEVTDDFADQVLAPLRLNFRSRDYDFDNPRRWLKTSLQQVNASQVSSDNSSSEIPVDVLADPSSSTAPPPSPSTHRSTSPLSPIVMNIGSPRRKKTSPRNGRKSESV